MNSKKAMELSINFIVILILTVVTFGGGLILAKNMFSSAGSIKDKISSQQEKQIQDMMLNTDELVVLPTNKATLNPGAHTALGLGINNVLKTGSNSNTFKVIKNLSTFQPKNAADAVCFDGTSWTSQTGCGADPTNFVMLIADTYTVKKNDQNVVDLSVIVPKTAKKGTYVYNIDVMYLKENGNINTPGDFQNYDTIKKLYVTVD